jgi:hypothetical protein
MTIRLDEKQLAKLHRWAQAIPGATPSGLARQLVDEGLRMADHPGVLFRDGQGGRRAALAIGPEDWEIVRSLRATDGRARGAGGAAGEAPTLPQTQMRIAMRYYTAYPDEIHLAIDRAVQGEFAAAAAR